MEYHARKNVVPLNPEPTAVWKEYGLQEAEKADYTSKTGSFTVTAYRLPDATAAQAAWQMLRPSNAAAAAETKLAARSGNSLLLVLGNYVLQFDGFVPQEETLNQLILHMPRYDSSSLPALTSFMPADGRVPNSERYILGPASLEKILPGLSPSLVAFHFGTEGQFARYRTKEGEVEMVILSYPNPQIAKERLTAFSGEQGLVVKRSGPLLAVVTKSPHPDAAERVLSLVRWDVNVTVSQRLPDPKGDNIGVLIVNIAKFSGLLVVFSVIAGAAFAGFRLLSAKLSGEKPGETAGVLSLHLDETSTE
jgi:hypothetical protein